MSEAEPDPLVPQPVATRSYTIRSGVIDSGPLLIALMPFGTVAGLAVNEAGYGMLEVLGFGFIVFAGAAQLAGLELFAAGAPLIVAIATMLVINARFAMYSAAMSQLHAGAPLGRRALLGYCTTDQSYALTVSRLANTERDPVISWLYTVAIGATVALVWVAAMTVGFYLGDVVPEGLPLTFAVPLTFISLAVPTVVSRPTFAAATTAFVVAVFGSGLPANLGLLAGAFCGITVGAVLELRRGV